MYMLENLSGISFLNTLAALSLAFVLGSLIGLERQYRQRTAGLRTNVLVAVGAALFVDLALRMHEIHGGVPGAIHVVAYVVTGVGFLGAGVIMREEGSVRGINTAATLWASAAVGVTAGAGLVFEAVLATAFVLAANTLLRPLVNRINQQPMDSYAVETTNTVHVITARSERKQALQLLEDTLEKAGYPVRDVETHPFGTEEVELEAVLVATSVEAGELDRLMETLSGVPIVAHAYWSPSTVD